MTAGLYFLAAYTCRHVGKWLEDKMFDEGASFPTTQFLLEADSHLSEERKKAIRSKIQNDFDIDLNTRTSNTYASRQRIHEAIGRVRQLFFKKNDIILMRNIQFGFAKNLAGGALMALGVSLVILIISITTPLEAPISISISLIIWYGILSLYGLVAMRSNAKRYAHILFDEFLAK